jgi:superfamily II DNA or RNA helicase
MKLRLDQQKLQDAILSAKQIGIPATLATSATGTGKTVVFSSIARELGIPVCAMAHRKELIAQISETFSRFEIDHNVVAPLKIVREIMDLQYRKLGTTYIKPNAPNHVASVDTLLARRDNLNGLFKTVKYWILDEGHHALSENKWGRTVGMFENASGLGVTGTDYRGDGRSLKAGRGGIYHLRIKGPTTRDAIAAGDLSKYRLYAPPNSIRVDAVPVGRNGDFNQVRLAAASENSEIIGDVISHYYKLTRGLKTICFFTDVKTSRETADRFQRTGTPAVHLDADSSDRERGDGVDKFRDGRVSILCNVELFGEGFDVPDVEAVIFARPTWSAGVFWQQFGRLLRKSDNKVYGIAIDAVGNILRHGLPDAPLYEYSWDQGLDGKRRSNPDDAPLRTCAECFEVFASFSRTCPFCGYKPVQERSASIETIEGDLTEITPEILAALRGEIDRIDAPASDTVDAMRMAGAPDAAVFGFRKKHIERQKAQAALRGAISLWGGREKSRGLSIDARYVKFYKRFGTDVLSAQAAGRPDAERLTIEIMTDLEK